MKWKTIALASAILLASCAEQVLKQHAEATIGQTMALVAAVHGPPNSSFDLDHTHRTFQYIKLGNSMGREEPPHHDALYALIRVKQA